MTGGKKSAGPSGVGGWLILFIAYLGIVRPILQYRNVWATLHGGAEYERSFGASWQSYEIAMWLIAAIAILCCLFLAYRLVFVRGRSTIKMVAIGVWVATFLPVLAQAVVLMTLFPGLTPRSAQLLQIAYWAAFPALCSIYMIRSKRVANTYVDDESRSTHIFG